MRILTLVFLIFGCFLGAGFVSGKEIATYFSCFGKNSIFSIILAIILFFMLILFFLFLSNKTKSFIDFFKFYFGKASKFINFLFALCLLILVSSMFAGSIEIAQYLNINKWLILIATLIFAYFVLIYNINGLNVINLVLVPIILLVIIISVKIPSIPIFENNGKFLISTLNAVNYVSINMVTLGLFILEIGHKYTVKEKIISAIICSIIIGVFMLIMNNSITYNHLENATMPLLLMAINKSKILWWISIFTVWIGLFTTLLSCAHLLSNYINQFVKNKRGSIFFSLFIGVIVSLFGFDIMVAYVYSIIGVIGLVIISRVILKEKRTLILKVRKTN